MKKIVLALALTAVLAGCQKQEVTETVVSDKFNATVENFELCTKTAMNPDKQVVWSSGDCIALFRGSSLASKYKVSDSSVGKTNGVFSLVEKPGDDFYAGNELPCNVAFYPYSESVVLSGTLLEEQGNAYKIDGPMLPKVQNYAPESFTNGTFLMAAVTESQEDRDLNFKNVLGALKLQLKGTQVVKSIKVEGANGEKLAGPVTVTVYANNLTPSINMSSEASTEVTLDCRDGIQLNKAIATNFYIALPPVHFEKGFTMTVIDSEEKVHTISATIANTVNRSTILVMPEVALESIADEPTSYIAYVDEYGINHGPGVKIDGIIWAPVNCGYHPDDYQWGKLYQWGRKYGQGYSGRLHDKSGNYINDISDATVPVVERGGIEESVGNNKNNANVFYSGWDWLGSSNDKLWNAGSEISPVKTEADPCPTGWRVPTYAELEKLIQNRSSYTIGDDGQLGCWFSGASPYTEGGHNVFLPAAGCIANDGFANSRGDYGFYLTSKPYDYYGEDVHASILEFSDYHAMMNWIRRGAGASVRCVQDASGENMPEDELNIPVSYVKLSSRSLNLLEGDIVNLVATIIPKQATDKTIEWTSSNTSVATVDQTGVITAVSAGKSTISAVAEGVVSSCTVTVLALADYVDEYGVNCGKGVHIDGIVWAPVNCGYHATDYLYGKLYQWGRKYGQGCEGDATVPEIVVGPVTLEVGNSESYSNVFFTESPDDFDDWLYFPDATLWNSGTEEYPVKTEYDPCPVGWRVPTYAEIFNLYQHIKFWNSASVDDNMLETISDPNSDMSIVLPCAGYRWDDGGRVDLRGTCGYYWSSKADFYLYHYETNTYKYTAYNLQIGSGKAVMCDYRHHANSVRCVQE